MAVLEEYPTPAHILKADRNKLISLIQKKSRKSLKWSTAKYELLVSKARDFAPLSIHNASNVIMLGVYYLHDQKPWKKAWRKSLSPFVY